MIFKEIHNAIPECLQRYTLSLILNNVKWRYIDDVSFPNSEIFSRQPGFNFTPLDNGSTIDEFHQFGFLLPLINEQYNNYFSPKNLTPWRLRIGMNIPGENLHNNPHVDHENYSYDFVCKIKSNIVALYYVNSDDGDTLIFNETEKSSCYTIKKRIKAEQGKLIFFDGNHYHASSPAKSSKSRLVVSLNLYEF